MSIALTSPPDRDLRPADARATVALSRCKSAALEFDGIKAQGIARLIDFAIVVVRRQAEGTQDARGVRLS